MMILAVDDTENLLSNGPTLAASSLDSSSSPWSELKGFRAGDQQRKVYAHVRVLNVGNIRVGDQSFDVGPEDRLHYFRNLLYVVQNFANVGLLDAIRLRMLLGGL